MFGTHSVLVRCYRLRLHLNVSADCEEGHSQQSVVSHSRVHKQQNKWSDRVFHNFLGSKKVKKGFFEIIAALAEASREKHAKTTVITAGALRRFEVSS